MTRPESLLAVAKEKNMNEDKQQAEREAFVEWLGTTYPNAYDKEKAEHFWLHGHVSALAWQARSHISDAQKKEGETKPTEAQVASACYSFRHDFGLLGTTDRVSLAWNAKEWLRAWQKEGFCTTPPAAAEAPAEEEFECCGEPVPSGVSHMGSREFICCGNPVDVHRVTEFNVGRFVMSEDDCRAEGLDFRAYERGVADAAEAFGRNRNGR